MTLPQPGKGLMLLVVVSLALLSATSGLPMLGAAPTPAGQSLTLLPDGRWLAAGGEGPRGPVSTAAVHDPRTGGVTAIKGGLKHARAWHTATVLPDGRVLIFGGVDRSGRPTSSAELFDPGTHTFHTLSSLGLTARAGHTATLLMDGTILVAGGASRTGDLILHAELWGTETGDVDVVAGPLSAGRQRHTATLLADGAVLLRHGVDRHHHPVGHADLFDPARAAFTRLDFEPLEPAPSTPAQLEASLPAAGATQVPVETVIALRFSKPLRVETVSSRTVSLTGPGGLESAEVVAAENGMLAFVTPDGTLAPGARYTVSLNGLEDQHGLLVPLAAITFTTATHAGDGHDRRGGDHDDHGGAPPGHHHGYAPPLPHRGPAELDDWEWKGERRDGKPYSRWQDLPPLQAPPGVTALAGQVLRLNGQPLAGVTLQMGDRTARTDRTGRFLLTAVMAGYYRELIIDGQTANRPGRTYGTFDVGVKVAAAQTNVLPYTIWMPLIDTQHATTIPIPTTSEVVATTPRMPGLEVRIPAGVVLQTAGGPLPSITLTQIPVDRPPFPLPEGTKFFFTPQAHAARVVKPDGTPSERGVRMILPNTDALAPGVRVDLWSYDTKRHGWHTYGIGTIARDGIRIVPDDGVEFHRVTCLFILGPPSGAPASAPPPGSDADDGDPVDLATGLFVYSKTDLVLPDVIPIVLTRTYRPNDGARFYPFGYGTSIPYQILLLGDQTTYTFAELVLPDGGRIRYNRISPGTGKTDAVMEHTATPTPFYKSVFSWNAARGGWDIKLKDGTLYEFPGIGNNPGPMLTAIQDRHGNRLTITRNPSDSRLIQRITSPNGRWIEFTNDPAIGPNLTTQVKDNGGRVVSYTYTPGFRLATVTDPAGGVTEFTYEPTGQQRMLTIKDARNIVYLTNEYDAAGRVFRQTQADSTTYQFAYTLDVDGKITQTDVTNPRGYVRRVTFNSAGYPISDTRAVGTPIAQTTSYVRDATSRRVTSMTDALSRTTAYTYDTMGNVLTVTRLSGTPDAVTTTLTYEPAFNQIATVTDPLSHTTTYGYDSKGDRTSVTNALGHQTTMTYNAAGQMLTLTTAAGTTTFAYDGGDLSSVTDPTGKTTSHFTDGLGRLLAVTDPLGYRTRYTYDALNQLTRTTDPLGAQTQLAYDANGNLLSLTDARNNATTWVYNSMDRSTTRTDRLLRAESYGYDSNGNRTSFMDRKSQPTSSTYDALDRLAQRTDADLSTTTYHWDAGNRVVQLVDSTSGTTTRTYDLLDRLTQEVTPQGTVSYSYDSAGRRTSMTVAGQATVTYGYDNADRLLSITQGTSVIGLAYDTARRRTVLTLPNGATTEYAYDAATRVTGLTYKNGSNVLGTLTYAYDLAGQRRQVGGSWARTGLPPAVGSATYNAENSQTMFGGTTLTYDLNGSLTDDGVATYTWDARNRLVALAGASSATFAYDALGRRTRRTINGVQTDFVYDGLNVVKEQSGTDVVNFVSSLAIDEAFTRTDGGGTRALLKDVLGSTVAEVDNAVAILAEHTYEPFGVTTTTGVTPNTTQFAGRENDGTGLYYYRARYYRPSAHRFISDDPIGFAGGAVNLYAYVSDNPVNARDSLGLRMEWGNIVLNNPYVIANLIMLNQTIVDSGISDNSFVITVTGGDRYRDAQGNIRSSTDNKVVSDSVQNSPHLESRGARGVDFAVSGISDATLLEALGGTSFLPPPLTYYDRSDNHWHTLLPNRPPFNNPSWPRRDLPPMAGRKPKWGDYL